VESHTSKVELKSHTLQLDLKTTHQAPQQQKLD
jgi:hypothetical protein